MDTLKSMRGEITRWLRGDLIDTDGQSQINDAINNGIERFWTRAMQVQISRFLGSDSPVSFTIAPLTERVRLVNIQDPTTQIVAGIQVSGGLPDRTYSLGYTYLTESGSETLQSPIRMWHANAGELVTVTAPASVAGALGWNLYAGQQNQALQNQNPLPFNVTLNEPATGYRDYPEFQQIPPTVNKTADNIAYIQHMELQLTDGTKKAWNQYEIDSDVMRALSSIYPSASEYATYAWDLIDGDVIELRPPAGTTMNPRYWYVKKPRRLRYDQADLPYPSITGLHEYLVDYAISMCKLSLEEYGASKNWSTKADEAMLGLLLAMNTENLTKNRFITPHLR